VIEAADGKTGLNLAFEHCPDIVLLDLAMPEFTGMDVLHGLQRMQRTRTIPVIVLSAYAAVLAPADASAVASVLANQLTYRCCWMRFGTPLNPVLQNCEVLLRRKVYFTIHAGFRSQFRRIDFFKGAMHAQIRTGRGWELVMGSGSAT